MVLENISTSDFVFKFLFSIFDNCNLLFNIQDGISLGKALIFVQFISLLSNISDGSWVMSTGGVIPKMIKIGIYHFSAKDALAKGIKKTG